MADVTENSTQDIVNRYRDAVAELVRYLPWLKEHAQSQVSEVYSSDQMGNTIPFAVYDSTLIAFVKAAQATGLMDRNWIYVYRRKSLASHKDELLFIQDAEIRDMDQLNGILSRYVLEGVTRGAAWSEGVTSGVFEKVLSKMDELIRYWDHPERN